MITLIVTLGAVLLPSPSPAAAGQTFCDPFQTQPHFTETTYLIANPRELSIEEHPWARLLPAQMRAAGVTVLGFSVG